MQYPQKDKPYLKNMDLNKHHEKINFKKNYFDDGEFLVFHPPFNDH